LACWGSRSGLHLGPLLIGPEECILRRKSFPMFSFWKFCDLSSVSCPAPRGWMLDGWAVKVTLLISDCNCSSFVWIARFVSLGTASARD